jgi:hypothetical protein
MGDVASYVLGLMSAWIDEPRDRRRVTAEEQLEMQDYAVGVRGVVAQSSRSCKNIILLGFSKNFELKKRWLESQLLNPREYEQ